MPILVVILVSAMVFGGGGYFVATKINPPPQEQTAATTTEQTTDVTSVVVTTTQPKKSTVAPIVKQTQNNESHLAAISVPLAYLDTDITLAQSFIADIKTDFINPTVERRTFVANANYKNDPMFNAFVKFDDEAISYYEKVNNDAITVLGYLKQLRDVVEQEKIKISQKFYDDNNLSQSERDFIAESLEIEATGRSRILNLSNEISAYDTKHFSEYKQGLELVGIYLAENAPSASTFQPTYYQPIVYPKVQIPQMPKTTYCNMNETGARNFYAITCNTY